MREYLHLEPIFSFPIYLGSASDWLNQISHTAGTTNQKHYQIWVVMHHQYGISVLVCQMSFCTETTGSIAKFNVGCLLKLPFLTNLSEI